MKNAFQKMILILLAVVMLAGIYTIAFAEDAVQPGNESISIKRQGGGDIYFGDEVTLCAYVNNVVGDYSVVWERYTPDGWIKVGSGMTYTFTVTDTTAASDFRAMLVLAD
ncbi:MAG: hypothetical protein IKM05_07205 [Clostridia bacterium]|nr:hypothetical protein [Clostridia bacterium]